MKTKAIQWATAFGRQFCSVVALILMLSGAAWANPVDINTADAQTLADGLTGVGPVIAEAIVDYREKHGPFRTIEELMKVRGVGERTLERNRQVIAVNRTNNPAKSADNHADSRRRGERVDESGE